MVINSPRIGQVLIPNVIDEIIYYEETLWGELEEGDLIELTFPKDDFGIMEISPGVFSNGAKKMVIKGKGFAMNREGNNLFSFAIPELSLVFFQISDGTPSRISSTSISATTFFTGAVAYTRIISISFF